MQKKRGVGALSRIVFPRGGPWVRWGGLPMRRSRDWSLFSVEEPVTRVGIESSDSTSAITPVVPAKFGGFLKR